MFTPKDLTPPNSSAIIQDIMELQKVGQATVAYFYFGFKDTQKQDLRNALASLLTQLSAHSDNYCDIFCHVHKAHSNGKYTPSNKTMITCLNDMLALPGQGPVYIILDALDECPNISGIPTTERGVSPRFFEGSCRCPAFKSSYLCHQPSGDRHPIRA